MTSTPWPSSNEIAGVVVDDQDLAAMEDFVGAVKPFEHQLFLDRQLGHDAMQEQGGLVEQPLGRLDVFEDDALGHALEPRLVVAG
jgi:hypothetical protein